MDGVAPCELVATLKSNGLDYRVEVGSDQQGPVLTDSLFTDVWNVLREHGNSQKTKISLYFDFEGHSPVSINPSIERIRKAGIEFAETCVRLLTHESFANMWWDGLVSAICSAVVDACQDIANDDLYELGESRRYLCYLKTPEGVYWHCTPTGTVTYEEVDRLIEGMGERSSDAVFDDYYDEYNLPIDSDF